MNPVIMIILQSLIKLGPDALDAINAIIRAAHGHDTSEDDHKAIGDMVLRAVANER
jgi:hypothetical protein